ncbi:hypothetical protein T4A_4770, partial [Trichinella pseudospiralis]
MLSSQVLNPCIVAFFEVVFYPLPWTMLSSQVLNLWLSTFSSDCFSSLQVRFVRISIAVRLIWLQTLSCILFSHNCFI